MSEQLPGPPPVAELAREESADEATRSHLSWLPSVQATVLAIVVSLVIGAVLIALSDPDFWSAMSAGDVGGAFGTAGHEIGASYWALLDSSLLSWGAISQTLQVAAPLICAGLGVTFAFRSGLFNIGAQGQLIGGAILGAYVGFAWTMPPGLHLLVALLAALLGGLIVGAIPGVLRARTGAHEVITTIMLNYVLGFLLFYLLQHKTWQEPGGRNPKSPPIHSSAAFPQVFSTHTGVILAFVAAAVVWWVLERTTLGFQLRALGANPAAAGTAGMHVGRLYTIAMAGAGLLAGLAAAMQVLGTRLSLTASLPGSIGFDAITVALLGRATPFGTLLAGLLYGALDAGGRQMQTVGPSIQLTEVLQALIVLFIAAPAAVRALLRLKGRGGQVALAARGWGS